MVKANKRNREQKKKKTNENWRVSIISSLYQLHFRGVASVRQGGQIIPPTPCLNFGAEVN